MKGHNGTVRSCKFQGSDAGNEGNLLATGGAGDNSPRLWDVEMGTCVASLNAHPEPVHGVAWIEGGRVLVTGCEKGILQGHDIRTKSTAWSVDLSNTTGPGGINSISAKGDVMAIGTANGSLHIISATTQNVLCSSVVHSTDVRSTNFFGHLEANPNSYHLLAGSFDGTASVSTLDVRGNVQFLPSPTYLRGHIDKVLAAVSAPITIREKGWLQSVAYKRIAALTTGADGKVMLWQL
jgi:WD40 repeat protein